MYNVCTLTRFLTIRHYAFRPKTRKQTFIFKARLLNERSQRCMHQSPILTNRMAAWPRGGAQ